MLRELTVIFVVSLTLINSLGFEIQPKIMNGVVSGTANTSYFVSISKSKNFLCGGSLLSDSWVITAGHCLKRHVPLDVSFGIRPDGTFETTITVNVSDQHIHPGYAEDDWLNDIGLIKLPQPIPLSRTIQPTTLSQNCDEIGEHETVSALGVGLARDYQYIHEVDGKLREATLTTVACESIVHFLELGVGDHRSHICASTTKNGPKTAGGDSGGPLIRQQGGVQFGILKGALRWRNDPPFHVFMKISFFFEWISQKTGLKFPECNY